MRPTHLAAVSIVAVALLGTGVTRPARAQGQGGASTTKEGRIPVRIVGGKLIARCDASSAAGRIPLNLMVELESQAALQLHGQAAGPGGLDLGSMEVQADFGLVTLHFPGFEISTNEIAGGPQRQWENFTRLHSEELGEIAVAGAIGARIFERYHMTLDLNAGFISLEQPHAGGGGVPQAERGELVAPITITNRVAWLPVGVEGDSGQVAAGLGTRFFDTIVDKQLCASLGKPAGDVGAVLLGDVDLAQYVAFRPGALDIETDDDAGFLIGLNILAHFRVELDRVNRWVRLTPTAPPAFPADDLAYFRALVSGQAQPLEAFLDAHGGARLAPEAAEQLLQLRMNDDSGDEALGKALRWTLETHPEDLRATVALELARDLHEKGRDDVATVAAEQGIEAGKKDRDPNAVHHLHGLVGEILLARGEGREAWRHLLSAAFGVPEDGRVNLGLGRYYEQEGRLRRAFSRYLQASITAEGGADAMLGLARVQKELGGDTLDVDEIEHLVEGKIQTYTAATKFEPTKEDTTNRTVLVEFFTTPHLERVGLAGELAFEASLTYYPRTSAVMLTYHLPGDTPTATPVAARRAAFYGVGNPGVNVIDGFRTVDGVGRMRDREKMMGELRDAIGDELLSETEYAMSVDARFEDGHVKGTVHISGAAQPNLVVHVILVERGVVFPGKSKIVIHRMLARGALTTSADGEPYRPGEDGKMELTFDRDLAGVSDEIEAHLEQLEAAGADPIPRVSTRIDPAQVAVVAFVQDSHSTVVQQAAYADTLPHEDAE